MESSWLGTSIEKLCHSKGPYSFAVTPVKPSKHHSVLYELPVTLKDVPAPHRNAHPPDQDHVRMPHSSENYFFVTDEYGHKTKKLRWETAKEAFARPIKSSRDFETAIKSYRPDLRELGALHYFFEDVVGEEEAELFFETMLPDIVRLAFKLPEIVPACVPILKRETNRSLSLSQHQISCLIANGFLCTFPDRWEVGTTCPGINFHSLFAADKRPKRKQCVMEKLKCIFHYFQRILTKEPLGVVTFERKFARKNQVPRWDRAENLLGNTKIYVSSSGTIEDGSGFLQVDFANKFIGGGVLSYGCVQEEIRFAICPELIASRLFTEELTPRDALQVHGVERYSDYSGYGDAFEWAGSHADATPFDLYGRRRCAVVAMDAVRFNRPYDQFNSSLILRELNKAYVGFRSDHDHNSAPVATGNWGCGAFNGDANLKFLIQLMACGATRRDMVYYTFGNLELRDTIYELYGFLAERQVRIVDLWRTLCRFSVEKEKQENFVEFVVKSHSDRTKLGYGLKAKETYPKSEENADEGVEDEPEMENVTFDFS